MGLTFLNPAWLWGLLVIPLLYYLHTLAVKEKKKAAMKFSSLGIIKEASRKVGKKQQFLFYISLIAIALLLIGLADPHLPLKKTKEGVNVVLVIDVSGSMQAQDYKPTRLEAAKKSAEILLKDLKPKDHAGIVIFESGATTAAYLSPFKDKVIEKLRGISPKEGRTALGDGLSLGVDMATSIPNKKKVIILLSDGVNNAGVIPPEEAIRFAKNSKIQVFTIGMGSTEPVLLGYQFGQPVYAQLDEETLKRIASETKGEYFKSVDENTLEEIYKKLSKKIKREKENVSIKDLFLVLTILLLLFELYSRYGKRRVLP
jgi:Ca-activated chloride channel family protein